MLTFEQTKKIIKVARWFLLIFPLVLFAIGVPYLVYFYHEYYSGEVTGYEELEKREYTFMKFGYSTGQYRNLEIYVAEEEIPLLGATSIDMKVIETEVLERAREGDILIVWVFPNSGRSYDYTVHEGSINGEFFLTMENYREMSRKNELVAVVIIPVGGVLILGFGIWFFHFTRSDGIFWVKLLKEVSEYKD